MQRVSTLITLFLFMFMLSWIAQAVRQEALPFRAVPRYAPPDLAAPESEQEPPSERITLPHRNGDNLPQPALPHPEGNNQTTGRPEPRNDSTPERETTHRPAGSAKESIHFLLLGRAWESQTVEFLMVVTLTLGSHSILTAIDPSIQAQLDGQVFPAHDLLLRGGGYEGLCRFAAQVSGFEPQFYIDLNIYGFVEMLDLLGGIDRQVYAALSGSAPPAIDNAGTLDGAQLLRLLTDPHIPVEDKEQLLVALLITARDIQNTTLGLSLLWTGYRNIRTNLGLNDLLEIRRITQEISPTRVYLKEVRAPEG